MHISERFADAFAGRFAVLPPYLAALGQEPRQQQQLWRQMEDAVINSSLPGILREKLFTLLSYRTQVPHCLHYHLYTLVELGLGREEISALLRALPPEDREINGYLDVLAAEPAPLEQWPGAGSASETALLWSASCCFTAPHLAERCRCALRRLLRPQDYLALFAFLNFVQACHWWITVYPEGAREADEAARRQLMALLAERFPPEEQERWLTFLHDLGTSNAETLALQELERYKERLKDVLEAIGDSVLLYDRRGRPLYLNAVARRLLPLLRPDYARTLSDAAELLPALPESAAYTPLRRILEEGQTIAGEQAIDVKIQLPGGQEATFSFSGTPVRGSQGQSIGAIVIGREVTARRRLEQRAHEALQALLAMAESLVQERAPAEEPAGAGESEAPTRVVMQRMVELTRQVLGCWRVVILGLDGDGECIQQVALSGASPQQEQRWREIVLGARLGDFLQPALLRRLRAGESLLIDLEMPEFAHLQRQIVSYPVRAILVIPMRLRERLIGALALDYGPEEHSYTTDELTLAAAVARMATLVLEREQLLEERAEARASVLALREANRRMDEFISFAGHELRAPLTVLKANAQLIKRLLEKASALGRGLSGDQQPAGPLQQRLASIPELLDRSISQVDLLDRLVGDLLDFSRIQSDTLYLTRQRQDLLRIVREVVEGQRQVHPGREIQLRIEAEGPITVNVDAARIGQVLTNYLLNAIRYAPPERPIAVHVRREGRLARVLVRDQGPGIAPELQGRVWERFYRAPGILVHEGSPAGLGLGLHICRTIMRLHQGEVGLESQPGAGATFWFALPLAEEGGAESSAE
jgi:signal transduction histidine kinase/PAS domain-containing protein